MFEQLFLAIFHFFQSFGAWGAFLSMFIENVGIPLPTEIGYLIGQNLINVGTYTYLIVLIILSLGHVFGSIVSYAIGRWGDYYINERVSKNNKISQIHQRLKGWYDRYGTITIFLTRFVGYVRPWSSYVAGLAEAPFIPFVLWTTLGSVIFNVLNLYLSSIFIVIWRRFGTFHLWILVIGFLFFFGFIFYELGLTLWHKSKSPSQNKG